MQVPGRAEAGQLRTEGRKSELNRAPRRRRRVDPRHALPRSCTDYRAHTPATDYAAPFFRFFNLSLWTVVFFEPPVDLDGLDGCRSISCIPFHARGKVGWEDVL